MTKRKEWSRQELLIAFGLYCQIQFGKMHSRNPDIIKVAGAIGRTPSAVAMKLTNIASIDPAITSTGRKGLSGASASDKEMWDEMQNNWENFVSESNEELRRILYNDDSSLSEGEGIMLDDKGYTGEDKIVKTKSRVSQNFFRKSVLSAYNYRCCITGLSVPRLLVASHIIPWRVDVTNRLNPRNGLALSMLHDQAFDIGIITICDDMTVKVAKKVSDTEDEFFKSAIKKYDRKQIALPEKFSPHRDFLAYHRKNIFQD